MTTRGTPVTKDPGSRLTLTDSQDSVAIPRKVNDILNCKGFQILFSLAALKTSHLFAENSKGSIFLHKIGTISGLKAL